MGLRSLGGAMFGALVGDAGGGAEGWLLFPASHCAEE